MNVPGDYLEVYVDDLMFDPPPPQIMAELADEFNQFVSHPPLTLLLLMDPMLMADPLAMDPMNSMALALAPIALLAPERVPIPRRALAAPAPLALALALSIDLMLATPDLVFLLFAFRHPNDSLDTFRSGGDTSPEPAATALPPSLFDHSYFRRPLSAHLPRPKFARAPLLMAPAPAPLAQPVRFFKPTVTIATIETIDDIQHQRRHSNPAVRKPGYRRR